MRKSTRTYPIWRFFFWQRSSANRISMWRFTQLLTSLPGGSFFLLPMSCSAKPCEKTQGSTTHQLHPFVHAQYRSVTGLMKCSPMAFGYGRLRFSMILTNSSFDFVSLGLYLSSSPTVDTIWPAKIKRKEELKSYLCFWYNVMTLIPTGRYWTGYTRYFMASSKGLLA